MPVRSDVDSTTTSSGTTVEGQVVQEGPGGPAGFVCDVAMMIDGDKLEWDGGDATPASDFEDKSEIYALWKDVEVKTTAKTFEVPVKWKAGAKGFALVMIVAIDSDEGLVSHDLMWLKKPKPGGVGKKTAKKKLAKSLKPLKGLKKKPKKK